MSRLLDTLHLILCTRTIYWYARPLHITSQTQTLDHPAQVPDHELCQRRQPRHYHMVRIHQVTPHHMFTFPHLQEHGCKFYIHSSCSRAAAFSLLSYSCRQIVTCVHPHASSRWNSSSEITWHPQGLIGLIVEVCVGPRTRTHALQPSQPSSRCFSRTASSRVACG